MKWFVDGDQLCVMTDWFINLQESPAVFVPLDSPRANALPTGRASFGVIKGLYLDMWRQLARADKQRCPNWQLPRGACGQCDYCEIAAFIL